MYRCIPFVVNNTPEKDWLFSILRQTQSIQAQDEWYLEYLLNKSDSDIIIFCAHQYTSGILFIIFMITDECIWWAPWRVCFGGLPMCYQLSSAPPHYPDHMLPILSQLINTEWVTQDAISHTDENVKLQDRWKSVCLHYFPG